MRVSMRDHRGGRCGKSTRGQGIVLVAVAHRMSVGVHDLDELPPRRSRSQPADAVSYPGKEQHPPAPHAKVATASRERDEDVRRENDERHADEAFHDAVDGRREPLREHDRSEPEDQDHKGMAEGVQRREPHRAARSVL